jgi:putative addiction module antidote
MAMLKLKVTTIGSSAGVILPKEALARLKVGKGDQLFMVETQDGYLLTPYNPSVDEQLKIGQDFMKEYRDTFRALAK